MFHLGRGGIKKGLAMFKILKVSKLKKMINKIDNSDSFTEVFDYIETQKKDGITFVLEVEDLLNKKLVQRITTNYDGLSKKDKINTINSDLSEIHNFLTKILFLSVNFPSNKKAEQYLIRIKEFLENYLTKIFEETFNTIFTKDIKGFVDIYNKFSKIDEAIWIISHTINKNINFFEVFKKKYSVQMETILRNALNELSYDKIIWIIESKIVEFSDIEVTNKINNDRKNKVEKNLKNLAVLLYFYKNSSYTRSYISNIEDKEEFVYLKNIFFEDSDILKLAFLNNSLLYSELDNYKNYIRELAFNAFDDYELLDEIISFNYINEIFLDKEIYELKRTLNMIKNNLELNSTINKQNEFIDEIDKNNKKKLQEQEEKLHKALKIAENAEQNARLAQYAADRANANVQEAERKIRYKGY